MKFLGKTSTVVKNGVLQIKELRKQLISRDRILSVLRSESIIHLGQVKRLYQEKTGSLSLLKEKEPQPGLAVLPEWDKEFIGLYEEHQDKPVCNYCGYPVKKSGTPCISCGNTAAAPSLK